MASPPPPTPVKIPKYTYTGEMEAAIMSEILFNISSKRTAQFKRTQEEINAIDSVFREVFIATTALRQPMGRRAAILGGVYSAFYHDRHTRNACLFSMGGEISFPEQKIMWDEACHYLTHQYFTKEATDELKSAAIQRLSGVLADGMGVGSLNKYGPDLWDACLQLVYANVGIRPATLWRCVQRIVEDDNRLLADRHAVEYFDDSLTPIEVNAIIDNIGGDSSDALPLFRLAKWVPSVQCLGTFEEAPERWDGQPETAEVTEAAAVIKSKPSATPSALLNWFDVLHATLPGNDCRSAATGAAVDDRSILYMHQAIQLRSLRPTLFLWLDYPVRFTREDAVEHREHVIAMWDERVSSVRKVVNDVRSVIEYNTRIAWLVAEYSGIVRSRFRFECAPPTAPGSILVSVATTC